MSLPNTFTSLEGQRRPLNPLLSFSSSDVGTVPKKYKAGHMDNYIFSNIHI